MRIESSMIQQPASTPTSDQFLLNWLRRNGSGTIADLVRELGVTATAVRQRLNRLMNIGLVFRETIQLDRGRPCHRYLLTEKGREGDGNNYAQLATVLWEEIRSIREPSVRSGLLGRIAGRMARQSGVVPGNSLSERMEYLASQMGEQQLLVEVNKSGSEPTLSVLACPYPKLAESDRGVCAMERQLFSELLGTSVKLSACRLDGASCCMFEPSA